jgi:hypothetical protein
VAGCNDVPQLHQQNFEILLKTGYNCLLPHSLQFFVYGSYNLKTGEDLKQASVNINILRKPRPPDEGNDLLKLGVNLEMH